jgi:hypothetical protein
MMLSRDYKLYCIIIMSFTYLCFNITTRLQLVYVAATDNLPLYYNNYLFYILLLTNL